MDQSEIFCVNTRTQLMLRGDAHSPSRIQTVRTKDHLVMQVGYALDDTHLPAHCRKTLLPCDTGRICS